MYIYGILIKLKYIIYHHIKNIIEKEKQNKNMRSNAYT